MFYRKAEKEHFYDKDWARQLPSCDLWPSKVYVKTFFLLFQPFFYVLMDNRMSKHLWLKWANTSMEWVSAPGCVGPFTGTSHKLLLLLSLSEQRGDGDAPKAKSYVPHADPFYFTRRKTSRPKRTLKRRNVDKVQRPINVSQNRK